MDHQSQTNYSANGYQVIQEPVSGDQLKAGKKLDLQGKLPDDFKPLALAWFTDFDRSSNFIVFSNSAGREQFYSDSRGVELVYDLQKSPPLKGVISRSGFHSIGEAVGPRFSSGSCQSANNYRIL